MKKSACLLIYTLLLSIALHAQVSLVQGGYPASVTGTDSLKVTTYTSTFPSLAPAVNAVWDMSFVADSLPVDFAYRVPGTGYPYADSNIYNISYYAYNGNVQAAITTAGIMKYGVDIQPKGHSLYAATTGINDSLYIDSQNVVYSSLYQQVAFPATYGSAWSSFYTSAVTCHLSILDLSYVHTPAIVKQYYTEKDSVTGWGKMRVKDISGAPSAYFYVLQVQTKATVTDSFFIDGAPAPVLLLSQLGFVQGNTVTTWQQNYYRAGEITPLAKVSYTDSTYTHPYSATTHAQRLVSAAVANVGTAPAFRVYPNPVSSGTICIAAPAGAAGCTYSLINAAGRSVAGGTLHGGDNNMSLPALPSGIYSLTIRSSSATLYTQALQLK